MCNVHVKTTVKYAILYRWRRVAEVYLDKHKYLDIKVIIKSLVGRVRLQPQPEGGRIQEEGQVQPEGVEEVQQEDGCRGETFCQ